MKLEIDIPSIIYNDAKENRNYISVYRMETIWKAIADGKPLEQEPKYCDRNICVSNEYNGIGCDECEVTKIREPKTGHWDKKDLGHVEYSAVCSECGEWTYWSERSNFCPNCGARMEEQDADSN